MSSTRLRVRKVAIIGAGVSGIASAIYLKEAGLDVTVFERSGHVGGVWVLDDRTPIDASYPSTIPSKGDSPEYEAHIRGRVGVDQSKRHDSPVTGSDEDSDSSATQAIPDDEAAIAFAPPGPCYEGLRNNVSTIEMEMRCHSLKSGTEEYVSHSILAEYLQDTAATHGVFDVLRLNTRVEAVRKEAATQRWEVETTTLSSNPFMNGEPNFQSETHVFDSVVVASGHYHASAIPDIPGLAAWKAAYPSRIMHSKLYRRSIAFKDENVLLIGAGTSSTDIARELAGIAGNVYQSSRGGMYDLPPFLLPDNAARVGGISKFEKLVEETSNEQGTIPGTVLLADGRRLCNLHRVIVCTGYHVSFPFMRDLHADGLKSADANETILVTDGQQTHNLHKDIFYIPDPTLAFIGVPYHTATFSCFEFQAMALASVLSGRVVLPSEHDMRKEYNKRLVEKGAGRTFHSLRGGEQEIAYVRDLVDMINTDPKANATGHSEKWLKSYAARALRLKAMLGRQNEAALSDAAFVKLGVCS